jgi:hypothetical protein
MAHHWVFTGKQTAAHGNEIHMQFNAAMPGCRARGWTSGQRCGFKPQRPDKAI